ncbi:MAG: hypothetical protein QM831_19325 [Kofleriaceae bacterium]
MTIYNNELYVGNASSSSIYVIPPTSTGAVTATRSISNSTFLNSPYGLGVINGELFVSSANTSSMEAYDPQFSSTFPYRRIGGASTLLGAPYGFVGFGTMLYTANYSTNSIQVFRLTADGDVAPITTITGAATKLSGSIGIAIIGVDE